MPAIRWSRICSSASATIALGVVGVAAQGAAVVEPDLTALMARETGAAQRLPVLLHLKRQPDASAISKRAAVLPQAARGGSIRESLQAFTRESQAPLLQDLQTRRAEQVLPLVTVNAVAARLTSRDIRELATRDDLASIRFDVGLMAPSRRVAADPCKPARPTPRQRLPKYCRDGGAKPPAAVAAAFDAALPVTPMLAVLGAPQAWKQGYTGKGVTVAIVDTGVDASHPDVGGSFRGGAADWFDAHSEHKRPMDLHGHGSQLAGLVSGRGHNGQTLGVAPQAQWIAARVYNGQNVARLSDLHRINAWLLDPDGKADTADAPQIVLNAWGFGGRPGRCDVEFAADVQWLRLAGMHVVFAAGNGGPQENTSVSPANNKGALSVGALDAGGQLSLFSSRGVSACDARPYPDLTAPGEMLRTTDRAAGPIAATTVASGTSYAAAVVAGELALLVQAKPSAKAEERESALRAVPGDSQPALTRALGLLGGRAASAGGKD